MERQSLRPPGLSVNHRSAPTLLFLLTRALNTCSWLCPVSSASSIICEQQETIHRDHSLQTSNS